MWLVAASLALDLAEDETSGLPPLAHLVLLMRVWRAVRLLHGVEHLLGGEEDEEKEKEKEKEKKDL